MKNKWLGGEGRTFVGGLEVLRDHSYQTGRKADFGNSSFYGSTFTCHGHLHFFLVLLPSFFSFPMKLSHPNLYSGLEAKIQKVAQAE